MGGGRVLCPITPISNSEKLFCTKSILPKFQADAFILSRVIVRSDRQTDRQTDGYGKIKSGVDADQEYIHFSISTMSALRCYKHLNKLNIP